MKELNIEPGHFTPKVILNKISEFTVILIIEGESYPENALSFYHDIKESIIAVRESGLDIDITFNLSYFNSSSTIQILDIFDILSNKDYKGIVRLTWWCEENDEDARESIEELIADCTFEKKILVK